jgi:processive 1,2-diacylglycerol beta-glucosyltransferase
MSQSTAMMNLSARDADVHLPPAPFSRVDDGGTLSYEGLGTLTRPLWQGRRRSTKASFEEPRILLLTSSLGSGHLRAAQAVEAALLARTPGAQVRTLDFWSLMDEKVAWVARNTYLRLVQEQPALFDRIYRLDQRMWRDLLERSDPPPPAFAEVLAMMPHCRNATVGSSHPVRGAWDRAILPLLGAALSGQLGGKLCGMRLLRLALVQGTLAELARRLAGRVRAFAPDAMIATQMNCAALLSTARRRLRIPTISVPTDFGLHDFWIQPAIEHYCVAHDSIDGLRAAQLDARRISVTGMPLMPGFRRLPTLAAARRELGLAGDADVVLVAGGGLGLGVPEIAKRLLESPVPLQLLVITGRNAKARATMQSMAAAYAGRLVVREWTDRMEVCIRAADVVVGKPGGLTVAEVLACGRPLIATRALGGQESFNVRFLERHRVGRLVDEEHLARAVMELLSDRDALRRAKQRAWRLGRRDGADGIAALAGQLAAQRARIAA